jgi:hypothetical protein
MKVKLLKDARIRHYEGEIVEVSPEEGFFLVTTSGAIEVDAVKTDVAKETPEEKVPKAEVPEKKVVRKTVAKKK